MKRAIGWWLAALVVAGIAQAQVAPAPGGAPTAQAAPASPYAATVPVAGTSDAQRNAAIAAALTQVLQQVSPGFVAGADVLAQAPSYVSDFHYQRAAAGTGLQLQVEFDRGAVSRLLAQQPSGVASGAGTPPNPATPAAAPGTGVATAGSAVGSGAGTLWVGGLTDGRAFATVLSELRADPALHDVTPVAAMGDGVLLKVQFDQPLATVLAALEPPTGHLAQAPAPRPGADASLRWVP